MEFINPSVELIVESDPFKKIEIAGRTCYKSEAAITDDSSVRFFKNLVEHGHTAMLEHATFVFSVPRSVYTFIHSLSDFSNEESGLVCGDGYLYKTYNEEAERYLVSGNLRAINESGVPALIGCLQMEAFRGELLAYKGVSYWQWKNNGGPDTHLIEFDGIDNPSISEIRAHKYTTMRFVTDRGVTHELVRHRPFSFAQESTRYVNYSREKFGGGNIKFIVPAGYNKWTLNAQRGYGIALMEAEKFYNQLIADGATAQDARGVLPNAVKTEIIVTGNDGEWQHFFNLRSRGTTGVPHPDMKSVADMALKIYPTK